MSKEVLKIILLGSILIALQAIAFTEPSQAPPGGNVPAPLNVGSAGQSKSGGLILNTGGAANGLIVDQGSVGIGTQSPTQKLDVIGYVRGATGLCIGGDCRTSWPGRPTTFQVFRKTGVNLDPVFLGNWDFCFLIAQPQSDPNITHQFEFSQNANQLFDGVDPVMGGPWYLHFTASGSDDWVKAACVRW